MCVCMQACMRVFVHGGIDPIRSALKIGSTIPQKCKPMNTYSAAAYLNGIHIACAIR